MHDLSDPIMRSPTTDGGTCVFRLSQFAHMATVPAYGGEPERIAVTMKHGGVFTLPIASLEPLLAFLGF